jgi:hypothetical protein
MSHQWQTVRFLRQLNESHAFFLFFSSSSTEINAILLIKKEENEVEDIRAESEKNMQQSSQICDVRLENFIFLWIIPP